MRQFVQTVIISVACMIDKTGPVIIKNILLNSAEHEFFLLINVKMQTFVGILTFVSMKSSNTGLSVPVKTQKTEVLDIEFLIYLRAFKISCSAE